uniref:Citrate transporter-like domain-containing protein n=1 Tax=Neobodo designis TaxID=312471 RepID=A0A7S1W748_NEODS
MSRGWAGSLAALFAVSTAFAVVGTISAEELFSGFTNRGMLVVALMYPVVNPIAHLPVARRLIRWLLTTEAGGSTSSTTAPRAKLCLFSWAVSPFLNNVPQVAVMTPVVVRVCRELDLPPSLLLLPMTLATCMSSFLLISTSSNLIVASMLAESTGEVMGFFELAKTNAPVSIVLLLYFVYATPYLLRGAAKKDDANAAAAVAAMNGSSSFAGASAGGGPQHQGRLPYATIAETAAAKGTLGDHDVIAMLGIPEFEASAGVRRSGERRPHRCLGKPLDDAFSYLPADVVAHIRLLGVLRRTADTGGGGQGGANTISVGDAPLSGTGSSAGEGASEQVRHFMEHVFDPSFIVQAHDVLVVAGRAGRIGTLRHLGPFNFVAVGVNSDTATAADAEGTALENAAFAAAPVATMTAPEPEAWTLPEGLVALPVADGTAVSSNAKERPLAHVVVADAAHGVGMRLRTMAFTGHYNCAVVACRTRAGEHLFGHALAMHVLAAGDALVVRVRPDFLVAHVGRPSNEFFVADPIGLTVEAVIQTRYLAVPECAANVITRHNLPLRSQLERRANAWYVRLPDWWPNVTLGVFAVLVILAMANVNLVVSCAVAVIAMVVLNLLSVKQAMGHVDWNVYVTGSMAFGVGYAIRNSGLAAWVGGLLVGAGLSGASLLLTISLLTSLVSNVVSSSVQVTFPIALAVVKNDPGAQMLPFAVAITNASVCGFITTFGQSTSLIIAGPGRYVARDFAVYGIPLMLIYTALHVGATCAVYGIW